MNYSELYDLEHKALPMMFLIWKEETSLILKNFSYYCKELVPSYNLSDFTITKDKKALKYIERYILPKDQVYCFSFPFKETPQYVGLAEYVYIIFNKERCEIRFYLLELQRWYNGIEWIPVKYVVEYKALDENNQGYSFLRKVYK